MKMEFKIETTVNDSIFETPAIATRVSDLLCEEKKLFDERYEEIKNFIDFEKDFESLSKDNVFTLFKGYWFKSIINKAIESIFSEGSDYNVYNAIVNLLTNQNLKEAIMGEPMIDAFSMAIRQIPDDIFYFPIRGSKILLLHKKYIEKSLSENHATVAKRIIDNIDTTNE